MKKILRIGYYITRTLIQLMLAVGIAWNVAMCMFASYSGNDQFELVTLLWAMLGAMFLNMSLKPLPKFLEEEAASEPAPANP